MNDKPTNNEFEKDLEESLTKEMNNPVRLATSRVVSLSSQIKELASNIIALDKDLQAFEKEVQAQIVTLRKKLGGVL